MQRLLEDAEQISGIEYDISSFASIIDAIHVVQEEMGITGAATQEAQTTIEGSLSSMKFAWQNLVTGIASGNSDLDVLLGNLIGSVLTAGENILPRLEQILKNIGEAVQKVAPIIAEQLPVVVSTVLPPMLEAGTQLLMALVEGIITVLPSLTDAALQIITVLVDDIIQMLPSLVTGAVQIVSQLANGISTALPILIPAAVEAIFVFLEGLTNPESMSSLMDGVIQLIGGLIEGLANAIPLLVEYAPEIIMNLITGLIIAIPKMGEIGVQLIEGLILGIGKGILAIPEALVKLGEAVIDGVKAIFGIHSPSTVFAEMGGQLIAGMLQGLSNTWENISQFFAAGAEGLLYFLSQSWESAYFSVVLAWSKITEAFQTAWNNIQGVWNGVASFFSGIWQGIIGAFSGVASFFGGVFSSAWSAVCNAWGSVTGFFSGIASQISGAFSSLPSAFLNIGYNVMEGLWNGIKSKFDWVKQKVQNAVDGIKGLFTGKKGFDTHSPSRWSRQLFENVMLGGGEGFREGLPALLQDAAAVADKVKNSMDFVSPGLQANMSAGFAASSMQPAAAAAPYGGSTINITVNGAQYSDERALAARIAQEIQSISNRRNAYAPA